MFVYIQSLMIMMLEILCCKIFFEAFGIKREENNFPLFSVNIVIV